MKHKETVRPVVYITPRAFQRLELYIKHAPGEIMGFGKIKQIGNDFLISELVLIEQEASGASAEFDTDIIVQWMTDLIDAGGNPGDYRCWWHSHANFDTFWSGTDNATIDSFHSQWLISLVGNKEGKYRVRIDLYKPIRLTFDKLELQVQKPKSMRLNREIKKEVTAKVKESKIKIITLTGSSASDDENPDGDITYDERTGTDSESGHFDE